jgi:hypothetical protein
MVGDSFEKFPSYRVAASSSPKSSSGEPHINSSSSSWWKRLNASPPTHLGGRGKEKEGRRKKEE